MPIATPRANSNANWSGPEDLDDPVGVRGIEVEEPGEADQSLPVLEPEGDQIDRVGACETVVFDELGHVLAHLHAHPVEERWKKRVPVDVLSATHTDSTVFILLIAFDT